MYLSLDSDAEVVAVAKALNTGVGSILSGDLEVRVRNIGELRKVLDGIEASERKRFFTNKGK